MEKLEVIRTVACTLEADKSNNTRDERDHQEVDKKRDDVVTFKDEEGSKIEENGDETKKNVDTLKEKDDPKTSELEDDPMSSENEENEEIVMEKNETPEEFVKRHPPSKAQNKKLAIYIEQRDESVVEGFKKRGIKLLESYKTKIVQSEEPYESKIGAELKEKILTLAKECKLMEGRWMLFIRARLIDDVWLKVLKATKDGRLGTAAKTVKCTNTSRNENLINIYTKDFTDKKKIARVLIELMSMGLAKIQLHYKPSAFTTLHIRAKNEYKMVPSIYHSNTLLRSHVRDSFRMQPSETPTAFVSRLRPSVPYRYKGVISVHPTNRPTEGLQEFLENGNDLVEACISCLRDGPKTDKDLVIDELFSAVGQLAQKHNVIQGHWMVFPNPKDIDKFWLETVKAVCDGRFYNAQIITKNCNPPFDKQFSRIITKNYFDKEDVTRVLIEIRKIGLVLENICYRADAYNYLQVNKRLNVQRNIYESEDLIGSVTVKRAAESKPSQPDESDLKNVD